MGIIADWQTARRTRAHVREAMNEALQLRFQTEHLEESVRDLEAQLVDEGWARLTTRMEQDFTRGGLDDLIAISGAMYLSHPLIRRAVNVRGYYTFAQGMSIQSRNEAIQEQYVAPFLDERGNQASLFSHQARLLTDIDQQCDGNTFFAMFTNPQDGMVRVRSVPMSQIREIITSPDDDTEVWFYRRCWTVEEFKMELGRVVQRSGEALYPDYTYMPRHRPREAGGIPIYWEAPIIHQRTGGRKNMLFGVPETYAALDWARAYRKFLEDWHTIVAALARFAWRVSVRGSKVRRTRERFQSTLSETEATETNPAKPAGSVFVGTDGDRLDPIGKSGATTSAEDARPSRLMVGAAMDLPDTILAGDAEVGNLATAKTLDRPTELAFLSRQKMYGDHTSAILHYYYEQAIRYGRAKDEDPEINVSFPPILEHDPEATVRAIVLAATLDGKVEAGTIPREELVRLLMQAVGISNVDDAIQQLADEDVEALARATTELANLLKARGEQETPIPPVTT